MNPGFKDMTQQRFGRLVAISLSSVREHGRAVWICRCDCGKTVEVAGMHLRSGHTNSCGCYALHRATEANLIHGHNRKHRSSPTYRTWCSMIQRCTNPKAWQYRYYGGRGIKVCERWRQFENFLEDMGERPPDKTLDKIDNNQGYSLANCRWATRLEQMQNTSRTKP